MFKKIVSKAVSNKVGKSKVVDTLKESYDYIIGLYVLYIYIYIIYNY